jgi:stalled ribosome alternative rescue factor ArfA
MKAKTKGAKAAVMQPGYRQREERPKKGRGSYQRKGRKERGLFLCSWVAHLCNSG